MYTPTKARVPLQSQLNLHQMTFGQTTKHLKEIKIQSTSRVYSRPLTQLSPIIVYNVVHKMHTLIILAAVYLCVW